MVLLKKKKHKKCIGFGEFEHKCVNDAGGKDVTYDFLCPRCDESIKKYLKNKFEKLGDEADGKALGERIDNEGIVQMLRTIKKQRTNK